MVTGMEKVTKQRGAFAQKTIQRAQRSYTIQHLVLLFFVFCFAGYVWEVALDVVQRGVLVNRGMLYGPWLPIYGSAGVALVLLCRRFVERPAPTFLLISMICGIVEYVASWAVEAVTGLRWWDYTIMPLNINGRVSIEFLLFFAAAGMAGLYLLAPKVDDGLQRLSQKTKHVMVGLLCTGFLVDVLIAVANPNTHAL